MAYFRRRRFGADRSKGRYCAESRPFAAAPENTTAPPSIGRAFLRYPPYSRRPGTPCGGSVKAPEIGPPASAVGGTEDGRLGKGARRIAHCCPKLLITVEICRRTLNIVEKLASASFGIVRQCSRMPNDVQQCLTSFNFAQHHSTLLNIAHVQ